MCTASWFFTTGGYELHFNRDESVRRGRARAPAEFVIDGVRALAPTDSDAGGTWLGVNEHGLALGLLNAWDARARPGALESRGALVRALLAAATIDEVAARLARESLARYRAFTLLALAPGHAPLVHAFDGVELTRPAVGALLASSSLEAGRAQLERERALAALEAEHGALDGALLTRFHVSHAPERGPWSPCMHRADARTVSASELCVDRAQVAMRYADGAPCTNVFGPWLALARVERGA